MCSNCASYPAPILLGHALATTHSAGRPQNVESLEKRIEEANKDLEDAAAFLKKVRTIAAASLQCVMGI